MINKKKYFTEYIDINFFKSNILGFECIYSFNYNEENYYISFYKNYKHIKVEYNITKQPYYYWLAFFDYNKYPEDILFKTKLDNFYNDCFEKLIPEKYNNLEIESIIKYYKEYITFHPYFLSYFEYLYKIIHSNLTNKYDLDIHSILLEVKSNLDNIRDTYDIMKDFIYWTLIFHNEAGKSIPPLTSLRLNEFYLNEIGKDNIFIKYLFKSTIGFLKNTLYSNQSDFMLSFADDAYDTDKIYSKWSTDGDVSYDHEFADSLNSLINSEQVLSKCPNCGRYFIKKYTSSTTYCTYVFRNTKANCQEYSARIKYQSKLYSNPIQAEYYLIRKRKSIKVKRGSLSEKEAKLSELCSLRDRFLDLYKNCSEQNREKIVDKFKEEINSLYKEDLFTHRE